MDDSSKWENLDVAERIRVVSADIVELLEKMCILTAPGGEVDSAVQEASQSFEPLFNLHGFNLEMNVNEMLIDTESEDEADADVIVEQEKSIMPKPSTSKSGTTQSKVNLSMISQNEHQASSRSKYRLEAPKQSKPVLSHQLPGSSKHQIDNASQVSDMEELPESHVEDQELERVKFKVKDARSRKALETSHRSATSYSSQASREKLFDLEELSEGDEILEDVSLPKLKSLSSRKTFGTSVYDSLTHFSSPSKESGRSAQSKRSPPSKSKIF